MTTVALPSIDFEMLADLKQKMAAFTSRFDQFILAGREQLQRETNEYTAGMAEDRLTQQAHLQAIAQTKKEQKELLERLRLEQEDVAEMEASIAEYSAKKDDMAQLKTSLEQQITESSETLTKKRDRVAAQRRGIAQQSARNVPELRVWESQLSMTIEAPEADTLRFVFRDICEDANKMHTIVIDVSEKQYKVVECYPIISVDALLHRLNESRDFGGFLKQVRASFRSLYR